VCKSTSKVTTDTLAQETYEIEDATEHADWNSINDFVKARQPKDNHRFASSRFSAVSRGSNTQNIWAAFFFPVCSNYTTQLNLSVYENLLDPMRFISKFMYFSFPM